MSRTCRVLVTAVVFAGGFVGVGPALQGRQQPLPAASVVLSPEEMDVFLRTASITKKKSAGKGVTDTIRATLSDGRVTHDAQIQTVDIDKQVFEAGRASEMGFKDTYRYNIGAYRLSRLLGMTNVPMSVKRRVDGKDAAVTWWIDDVQFDEQGRLKLNHPHGPNAERTIKQIANRLVFDELIQNKDRNQGNLIWTKDWTLWLIDHTRAFRLSDKLMKPEQITRCSRALFDALRGLTLDETTRAMGDVMTKSEINAVMARRDLLVKHLQDRIARLGEPVVLFTM